MKKSNIIIISILGLLTVGCIQDVGSISEMGGGTLGAVESIELSCSESDAKKRLEELLKTNSFKISESDSTIVEWWERNGYDFLNYVCINIQGTLYMASLNSESSTESEFSIRSYYDRSKTEWMFAVDFSNSEYKKAKKSQKYLQEYMGDCR